MTAQPSPPESPPHPPEAGVRPLSWALVFRVLGIGTVISLFFALLAPFGSGVEPLIRRTVQIVVYGWFGGLLGLASARLVARTRLWRNVAASGIATGLLMTPPMLVIVWLGAGLSVGRLLPASALPEMVWQTVLICVALSFLSVAFARRRVVVIAPPGPPKFLDRLPFKLRGAEIWAVEAEDHYLRLHTSKGQDLILMRLADAVDELAGIEGAQVHRSWWVARDAITDARRGEGRATLTLKDGSQVPVSRTYARELRALGWI